MMVMKRRRSYSAMKVVILLALLPLMYCEQGDLFSSLPPDVLAGLMNSDPILSASGMGGGGLFDEALKEVNSARETFEPLLKTTPGGAAVVDAFSKGQGSSASTFQTGHASVPFPVVGIPVPIPKKAKLWKAAVPLKKVTLKKSAKGVKVIAKKAKVKGILKKPQVYSLKPIVHVIEKPVAVYHKVPVPKKVLIPKFYKVMKPIPVPKIIPVPFKVPVKKIIPKIVKIPKAIPVPKFVPVKKYIPIGIPYPVPKIVKFPVFKPAPYKKFIPIPIPKKVPKFIPFPVKKIIKIPKPYYVPIKVPHFTASYVKAPMYVKVPAIPKPPVKLAVQVPTPVKVLQQQEKPKHLKGKEEDYEFYSEEYKGKKTEDDYEFYSDEKEESVVSFIPSENKEVYKMKDAETDIH